MSRRSLGLDDRLYDYILRVSVREPPVLARLREETGKMPEGEMQISPEQGQFLALLCEIAGAQRAIEIGTFTGYSAAWIAGALGADGKLIACDVSEEWTSVARRHWAEIGVSDRIDLRIAPALQTLDALRAGGEDGTFDFVFIDADKENVLAYWERALALLRVGGLIAVDNVLWSGSVADPENDRASTKALRALNDLAGRDERVSMSLIPIGDGLLVARKR